MSDAPFSEAPLGSTLIRDLHLTIAGTPLEPVLAALQNELVSAGLHRLHPRFYLSTEWGVPFDTVAIAIPFYLARPDLTALHAHHTGHVEGLSPADILRYLRHEMGHVVNYAYRLYDDPAWVERFGAISQPYLEHYRPEPFSRRFVRHLPGWYAQKHPDEDWAETFAVWLTPGLDWRAEYADWPEARDKLEFCAALMHSLVDREPLVTSDELDEDVGELAYSLDHYYARPDEQPQALPHGLDGALRAIFADLSGLAGQPAGVHILGMMHVLPAEIYRWTGHFPEHTRDLLRELATRADHMGLVLDPAHEPTATVALTTFVTALAMNHVRHGNYLP